MNDIKHGKKKKSSIGASHEILVLCSWLALFLSLTLQFSVLPAELALKFRFVRANLLARRKKLEAELLLPPSLQGTAENQSCCMHRVKFNQSEMRIKNCLKKASAGLEQQFKMHAHN